MRMSLTFLNRERSSHGSPLRSLSPNGSVVGIVGVGCMRMGGTNGERGNGRDMAVAVAAVASGERGKGGVGGVGARMLTESLALLLRLC
jgi:hypothetical protein